MSRVVKLNEQIKRGPETKAFKPPKGIKLIVSMSSAFDRRDTDPKKNFGIHGVHVYMAYTGPKKAAVFSFGTSMHLPHVVEEYASLISEDKEMAKIFMRPMGFDVGVHSTRPQYEGQPRSSTKDCKFLDVKKACYYDGGDTPRADELVTTLLTEGSDGVWKRLKKVYDEAV